MSKKRNGNAAKPRKRAVLCERCGWVARASVRVGDPPDWAHKAGDFGRLREERHDLTLEQIRACAVAAGITDLEGNLMPRYQ